MTITKTAKTKILNDVKVRAALMSAFDMSEKSVQNWIARNDIRLTTPKAVGIISKATGLTEKQILN